jgi:hypothetical protein
VVRGHRQEFPVSSPGDVGRSERYIREAEVLRDGFRTNHLVPQPRALCGEANLRAHVYS